MTLIKLIKISLLTKTYPIRNFLISHSTNFTASCLNYYVGFKKCGVINKKLMEQ